MRHIVFSKQPVYKTAVLIKTSNFNEQRLLDNYINKFNIPKEDVVCLDLEYVDNKASAKTIKAYLEELLPVLKNLKVKNLFVADGAYFKTLTKVKKVDSVLGYSLPGKIKGYEEFNAVYCYNYSSLVHNPTNQSKIDDSISCINSVHDGSYVAPGTNIIKEGHFPCEYFAIKEFLNSLHQHDKLVCDTETFSLKHWEAGIAYIGFAWAKDKGGCFKVDHFQMIEGKTLSGSSKKYREHKRIRNLLIHFFNNYKGKLYFHNAAFDVKVLVSQLYLSRPNLSESYYATQKHCVKMFMDKSECTMNIAYLATNNAIENKLSLKDLAQKYCGNWAEDVNDIRKVDETKAKEYCLKDCLATFYVLETYYPIMVADNQLEVYEKMFRPALNLIINAELNGMPMNLGKVKELREYFTEELRDLEDALNSSFVIEEFNAYLQNKKFLEKNLLVKKTVTIEEFKDVKFNPGSPKNKTELLHDIWKLPVNSYTAKGNPETGADALEGYLAAIKREYGITDDELLK